MYNRLKLVSLTANEELTKEIAKDIGVEVLPTSVLHFKDGEILFEGKQSFRGDNVYIVQSTCAPVTERLMEVLICCDALKRASASSIDIVMPYYGYSRQDRKAKAREPITARLVADLLQTAGVERVVAFDLHAPQIEGFFNCSIMSRAQKKGLAEIHIHNLRDYAYDRYRKVDDYPFGGFAGMVMKIEPIDRCISALKAEREYDEVIFTSPDGEQFNQPMANSLSMAKNLIILCGHFKGIDYRIREHLITREVSVGNFVLTGGELAASIMADAIVRIIPGVISDEQSALSDCFQDDLLSAPVYTRPAEYKGWKVPDILLSGHERKIAEWRLEQSLERTKLLRPDLLKNE